MTKTMLAAVGVGAVALSLSMPTSAQNPSGWDRVISNAAARFKVQAQFNNEAVLDQETGLLWERSPGDTNGDGIADESDGVDWYAAHLYCNDRVIGNRKGWRLPTIQELASLVDPAAAAPPHWPVPALTPGHPFTVSIESYWSATGTALYSGCAWSMFLGSGKVHRVPRTQPTLPWCVRSGQGVDAQ